MRNYKKAIAVALSFGCLLLASGCGKHPNTMAGRLYYTASEIGCTRIEWTDIDGLNIHHVLGAPPLRDEFSDRNVNEDDESELARNSKYVYSPIISSDGRSMLCLYGKTPVLCLYNLETGRQEKELASVSEGRGTW